jgi:hypothetical protein
MWSYRADELAVARYLGADLWNRMSTSFGYFNKYGYGGHLFPVVIGECGSFYTDVSSCFRIATVLMQLLPEAYRTS